MSNWPRTVFNSRYFPASATPGTADRSFNYLFSVAFSIDVPVESAICFSPFKINHLYAPYRVCPKLYTRLSKDCRNNFACGALWTTGPIKCCDKVQVRTLPPRRPTEL
jgi:hypothetical protein